MLRTSFLKNTAILCAFFVSGCDVFFMVSNQDALQATKVECPEGTHGEYGKWEHGDSFSCKLEHGPYVSAQMGKVFETGQYYMGKEAGEWKLYDKKGDLLSIRIYDTNGKLLLEKRFK